MRLNIGEEILMEKKNSFEDNMEQLEGIVKELEEGKLNLEQSVEKFEEGMKLSKTCDEMLETAEKKITMLIQNDETIEETNFEA